MPTCGGQVLRTCQEPSTAKILGTHGIGVVLNSLLARAVLNSLMGLGTHVQERCCIAFLHEQCCTASLVNSLCCEIISGYNTIYTTHHFSRLCFSGQCTARLKPRSAYTSCAHEVAFKTDMLWSIPQDIYAKLLDGENAGYALDLGGAEQLARPFSDVCYVASWVSQCPSKKSYSKWIAPGKD